jgi:hypothetical protein
VNASVVARIDGASRVITVQAPEREASTLPARDALLEPLPQVVVHADDPRWAALAGEG